MNLIEIKQELIAAEYWMIKLYNTYDLSPATSSQAGINGFVLKTHKIAEVKLVIRTEKPIPIGDKKVDTIVTARATLTVDSNSTAFITSPLMKTFEGEPLAEKAEKYMNRIIGALHTIETVSINAANSSEGSDTSTFTMEEKSGRARAEKASSRLKKVFKEMQERVKETDFVPAYEVEDLPEAVLDYIQSQ